MSKPLEIEIDLALRENRDHFFRELYYRVFPSVAKFVRNHNGTLEDAKDIFHDALILHYEQKLKGIYPDSDEAYVIGIAKNLWYKTVKQERRFATTDDALSNAIPQAHEADADTASILHLLESAGKKCMQLLQDFYYHNKTTEMIKTSFGFSSVHSATVQKFKCLEKIRDVVKSKTKTYADFFE